MNRIVRTLFQGIAALSLVTALIPPTQATADTSIPTGPTELQSFDTQFANVYRNPNGTITSKVYFTPVNYQDESGNFQHIDTNLVPNPSGGFDVTHN